METYADRFNTAVAAELRAERARRNITFADLTARTGFAQSTVINYLNDRRPVPVPALATLCAALECAPTTIMSRAEDVVHKGDKR